MSKIIKTTTGQADSEVSDLKIENIKYKLKEVLKDE